MGNGNKVEFLVAICALVSSIMAVYMAWDQGRVMRAQQHGMVYPVLQVDGSSSNTPDNSTTGITVRNSGVGPALIESVALRIDGQKVSSLPEVLARLPLPDSDSSWGLAGRALAPGAEVEVIHLRWARDRVSVEDIRDVVASSDEWELEICYCSVFGRCWQTESIGQGRAASVEACIPEDTDLFAQFSIRDFHQADAVSTEQDTPASE